MITKKPWFESLGQGFKPVCWEGWMVLLVAVAVIAGSYHIFGSDVGLVVLLGVLFVVALISLFTTESFFL